jgi:tetratricopeptide (TPR) repeat protein
MNVFISWSGTRSRSFALVIHDWLQSVVQAASPWMSDRDIGAGERWNEQIARRLRETEFGLICLTPSNLTAPWLLFEAGALAKTVDTARVVPVLLGVRKAELKFPLAQFQAVIADREGLFTAASAINETVGDRKLTLTTLGNIFNAMWPELERKIDALPPDDVRATGEARSDRDILEELNNTVRSLHRSIESTSSSPRQDAYEYVGTDDESWEVHYVRGVNLANSRSGSGGNIRALIEYNVAIALAPQTLPSNTLARLYSFRGAMLKRLGRLAEAEGDIQLALKMATGAQEVNDAEWNMACIEAMTGRKQNAIVRLRQLISGDKRWIDPVRTAPYLKDLHGDPEFQRLIRVN